MHAAFSIFCHNRQLSAAKMTSYTVCAWRLMGIPSLAFALRSCACSTVSAWRQICARCLSFARSTRTCCIYSLCLAANAHPLPGPENVPPAKTLPASQPVCSCGRVVGGGSSSPLDIYKWVAISPSAERLTQLGRLRYVTDKQTDKQIWSFRPRPDRRFGLPIYLPPFLHIIITQWLLVR